jgi:S1-C subfamily serine protease
LIGIQVEVGKSKLDGRSVDGVAITNVWPDSPAALAGLKGWHSVQMVKIVHLEIYDLIIAIDGGRVRDIFDLDDSLHDLKPGEIVYFTIVRDHRCEQVPVSLPAAQRTATQSQGAQ